MIGSVRLRRTWIGIIIIVIGLGLLLEQTQIISITDVLAHWWPLILIIIGFIQLFTKSHGSLYIAPLFIIVGILLLLHELSDISVLSYLWPIIIIYIGLIIILDRRKHDKANIDKNNVLDSISLFSGADIKSQSNPFQGGSILTVFGGAEVDLRHAVIIDEEITIEITSIFGGVSLKVPESAYVEISGIPIFGGWENKTQTNRVEDSNQPIIHLKCVTIFGGVEVRD